jgi:outer membrane biosynthesis protein TonB
MLDTHSESHKSSAPTMKRPAPPRSDSDTKPEPPAQHSSPSPSATERSKPKSEAPSKSPTKKPKSSPTKDANTSRLKFDPAGVQMEWNSDGREALMDYLIAEGLKGKDKALLAEKVRTSWTIRTAHRRELTSSLESRSRRSTTN